MEKKQFGKMADGTELSLYTFTNQNGMSMSVTELGATLVRLFVPDRSGKPTDVVLGYDTAQEYLDNTFFFGAVIARHGNRVDKARFRIGDCTYQLPVNDNENNLHSGPNGMDKRVWEVDGTTQDSITFHLLSPDGDNGFPGNFDARMTYRLREDNTIVFHYEAESDKDTVANMTNHSYFNLAGHDSGSVEDQVLKIFADHYTPVRDAQAIPTGEIAPVEGTPMDFRSPKAIGRDINADFEQLRYGGGYDHNFVLSDRPGEQKKMAEVYSDETGICLEGFTDCCAMQFYAGNMITDHRGKGGADYRRRQGFCLESQYCPNAINEPAFTSPILRAGEKYESETSYRFSVK